jgi:uncharacterized membrane protein
MDVNVEAPRPRRQVALERAAHLLLAGHVALIAVSTIALTTFLAGTPPEWLQSPSSQRALRIGWTFSGPTYVVLGALATLAHAWSRLGVRRALGFFAIASLVALGSELSGTTTGFPFGSYAYTPLLGWRIAGHVPFPIPVSWFYMIYASLAICARVLPAPVTARDRVCWAVAAGLVLTAWDVAMDPAMVRTAHWVWGSPGFFYGMPLTNWIGWILTGSAIAWLAMRVAPPALLATRVAPSRFPLVLYAANAVLPIAICIRHEMWYAAILGAALMGGALALATRDRARVRVPSVQPIAAD